MPNVLNIVEWASREYVASTDYFENYLRMATEEPFHQGDCTNQPWTCVLCCLEDIMKEYREYCAELGAIKEYKCQPQQ
jgi:hypothetical protein